MGISHIEKKKTAKNRGKKEERKKRQNNEFETAMAMERTAKILNIYQIYWLTLVITVTARRPVSAWLSFLLTPCYVLTPWDPSLPGSLSLQLTLLTTSLRLNWSTTLFLFHTYFRSRILVKVHTTYFFVYFWAPRPLMRNPRRDPSDNLTLSKNAVDKISFFSHPSLNTQRPPIYIYIYIYIYMNTHYCATIAR